MNYLRLLVLLSVSMLLWSGCDEKKSAQKLSGPPSVDQTIKQLLDTAIAQKDAAKGLAMIRSLYHRHLDSATHAIVCHTLAKWYFDAGLLDTSAVYNMEALPYLEQHSGFARGLIISYYMIGRWIEESRNPNFFLANNYRTKCALLCTGT